MTAFIISAVIIVILLILYVNQKRQKSSEKSDGEKILSSLCTIIKDKKKRFSNNLRSSDLIKKELIQTIDKAEEALKNSCREHLKGVLVVIANTEALNTEMKTSSINYRNKAKELYSKYKESKNEYNLTLSKKFMSQSLECERQEKETKKKLEKLNILKETSALEYQLQRSKFVSRRVDIELIVSDPNINLALELEKINDLTKEFNTKILNENIKIEVNKTISDSKDDKVYLDDYCIISEEELIVELNKE